MLSILLNDGNKIPAVGLGVFLMDNGGPTYEAVSAALKMGYRHIDTAAAYFNEEDVGRAVRDSGLKRSEIFITSKLWLQDHGYEGAKRGLERSLRKLGTDHIDLYLIHQPYGDVPGAWKALEEAKAQGLVKSIGVSNMTPRIWQSFVPSFKIKPAVNQVEFNPLFLQKELRALMQEDNCVLEAWFPLGHGNAALLSNQTVVELASRHQKTPSQIILRFEVQEGAVVLPKSVSRLHQMENLDIFNFELGPEEMSALRLLDTGKGMHDPDAPGTAEKLLSAYKIED